MNQETTASHPGKCYRRSLDVVSRQIADEFILVPIRHQAGDIQCIYTLNSVGARVWESIDGGKTVEDVVTAIVTEYEVDTPQAMKDTLEFLAQMEAIGAVIPILQEAVLPLASEQVG